MSPEQVELIERLYQQAREHHPEDRERFLAEVCGDNEDLRRRVSSRLDQDSSGGPIAEPVSSVASRLVGDGPITPGFRVGPYEIESLLGAGGMGTVYKARDTRLGRRVAIKIPHEELTGRFQREARAISALNHPHICTLYDVGPNYLVMELLEGETMARRLKRGRLAPDLAMRYGAQLADALSAAHAGGITHRDLKPGNVVLTRTGIKVLDFGLAKFTRGRDPSSSQADTVTATQSVVGTPAYMAPEQLEGKECDARTDIFALGLVMYEMATGKRAFNGESQAALIAEIMRCQPALDKLAPPQFAHIVERCLAKDPEDRWQTARDVRLQLDFLGRTLSDPQQSPVRKRGVWPGAAVLLGAAAVAVIALAVAVVYFKTGEAPLTAVPLTSYPGLVMSPSLSPDGTHVAFAWNGENEGNFDIYVKQIGPGNAVLLTSDAAEDTMCRWSPDGRWIAFLRRQRDNGPGTTAGVYIVPALGGLEKKLGDAAVQFWDNIMLGGYVDCLDWSPDGRWLVISRRPSPGEAPGLALLPVENGEIRQLTSPSAPQFDVFAAFAPDGHALAFVRRGAGYYSGSLMVLPLSGSLLPRGPAIEIPLDPGMLIRSVAWSSDSRDLIASAGHPENVTLWRATASSGASFLLLPFPGGEPAISHRGDRLVFSRHNVEQNIWSLELDETGRAAGQAVRAFDSSKSEYNPRFSPDGTKVAFESSRSGYHEIWVCRSNGAPCDQLTEMRTYAGSPDWSPNGEWIAFDDVGSVYVVSAGGGKPRRLAQGLAPRWSQDGQWVYFSFGGGAYRIPFAGGDPQQLTRSGGSGPTESPDGRWLYYSRKSGGARSLYRVPSAGGESMEVLTSVAERNYVVLDSGIWYFTPNTKDGSELHYYDFATQSKRTVFRTSRPIFVGMSVSPDRRRILFSQTDRSPSRDLMLVENFR